MKESKKKKKVDNRVCRSHGRRRNGLFRSCFCVGCREIGEAESRERVREHGIHRYVHVNKNFSTCPNHIQANFVLLANNIQAFGLPKEVSTF